MENTTLLNVTKQEVVRAGFGLNAITIVMITLYGLICLIGLLGNGLVVFVVLRYHRLKTVTNIYILNLSVADGLFLVVLPMLITTAIAGEWVFGIGMCKLYYMLTCINYFVSAFTLTVMAIDRYLATCHPIRSLTYRTARYALVALSIIWSLSFLVMLPVIMYASVDVTRKKSCTIVWPDSWIKGETAFTIYNMIIAFVIPVVLICTFYAMIIARLKNGGPGSLAHRRHCQFRKATRLVTLIIAVFIICWSPHWAIQLYLVTAKRFTQTAFHLYQVFTLLMYSNSMLNPLLYAFTNEYFRDAFRGAFHCLPEEMMVTSRRTSALQCIESGNICQQLEARFDSNGQVVDQHNMVTTVTDDVKTNNCKTPLNTTCLDDVKL